MQRILLLLLMGFLWTAAVSQQVIGPMLGPTTFRTASVWMAMSSTDPSMVLYCWPKGGVKRNAITVRPTVNLTSRLEVPSPITVYKYFIGGLEPGQEYEFELAGRLKQADANLIREEVIGGGTFRTQTLFQWRGNAPDFSFLTGSCAYFNDPPYDRPGKPYGQDSSIFESMAKENAQFMLWLGDNWYTRDVDYTSEWGLWDRAYHDRGTPVMRNFLKRMPHLAIWDDHDYGPNDYGKSYVFKSTSREVFRQFWMNPSYGENNEGTYSRYTYNDVDFFMLDNRWWRDYDKLPDSVNGQPNPNKLMYGKQQLEWLKNELRYSKSNPYISFRVIATGSQVLNPGSSFDKLLDFPAEYYELMNFLRDEKIDGVVFLTGDRHHSEIIKVQHNGLYPLYDITCSPLTSGTHTFGGKEANNPWRVLGIDQLQNYGKISVTGPRSDRVLKVTFNDLKGVKINEWQVNEKELRLPK